MISIYLYVCGLGTALALFSHTRHPKTLPKPAAPQKSSSALEAPQHLPCRSSSSPSSSIKPSSKAAPSPAPAAIPFSCQIPHKHLGNPVRRWALTLFPAGLTQKNTLRLSPLAHSNLLVFQPKSGGLSLNFAPSSLSWFAKPISNSYRIPQRNSLFIGHINKSVNVHSDKPFA